MQISGMYPRFVGRLSLADGVTVLNAVVGFIATVVAFEHPDLAARLILLAAVADGLDGVIARHRGGSKAGPYLDSLADVASFAVAPAVLVFVVTTDAGILPADWTVVAYVIPGLFVGAAVTRLGLYTAYDAADKMTEGVPSTLAATIIGASVLSGLVQAELLFAGTAVFCYLMVSTVQYPDLLARDALIMGVVHTLAVLFPTFLGRTFPIALLTLALAYLFLGPRFYWRESPDSSQEGKTLS